jgi:hypothetical protein
MYCSTRCKAKYRKAQGSPSREAGHNCRICGTHFPIGPGQHNKWLCSDECRRASVAKSMREFHKRRPLAEAAYRAKTKAKRLPESNLVRFRRNNPDAPTCCEACGEDRVLEIAHKPSHPRLGAWRSVANTKWPEKVWILCPTCHRLLDRMNYTPSELGLKE